MLVHIIFTNQVPDANCVANKGVLLPQAAPAPGLSLAEQGVVFIMGIDLILVND